MVATVGTTVGIITEQLESDREIQKRVWNEQIPGTVITGEGELSEHRHSEVFKPRESLSPFDSQNPRFLRRACTDTQPDSKICRGIRSSNPDGDFGFQHFTVARVITAVGGSKDEFLCEMDTGSCLWRLRHLERLAVRSTDYQDYSKAPLSKRRSMFMVMTTAKSASTADMSWKWMMPMLIMRELVFDATSRDITVYFYGTEVGVAKAASNVTLELHVGDGHKELGIKTDAAGWRNR